MKNKNDIYRLFRSIRERVGLGYTIKLEWDYKEDVKWSGQYCPDLFTITLNYFYIQNYKIAGIREVIIHEFAHAALESVGINAGHGRLFKTKVKELGGMLTGTEYSEKLFLLDK